MYVRINRGTFDTAKAHDDIEMLRTSEEQLAPALKQLPGLHSYQTGVDAEGGTMIAISVWDTAEHAQSLSQLPEMNALRSTFQRYGIVFDPISTYDILWQV
jgi:quinol monooxygenase YgiN